MVGLFKLGFTINTTALSGMNNIKSAMQFKLVERKTTVGNTGGSSRVR
jgi:hypothetical protein